MALTAVELCPQHSSSSAPRRSPPSTTPPPRPSAPAPLPARPRRPARAHIPGRSPWPSPARGRRRAAAGRLRATPSRCRRDHLRTLSAGVGQTCPRPDLPDPGRQAAHGRRERRRSVTSAGRRGEFPAFFVPALVARLAAELCLPADREHLARRPAGQARRARAAPGPPGRQPAVDAAPRSRTSP